MIGNRSKNIKWNDIDMANLGLTKLITHFEHTNRANGQSDLTVSWYTEMLTSYVKFLKPHGGELLLSDYNAETARDFIAHEQRRQLSQFTIQCKVRSLKAFVTWLVLEGYPIAEYPNGKSPIYTIKNE